MIAQLLLAVLLVAPQCKVVWRDAGNGKQYESKVMTCAEARKERDRIERQRPSLEVWVEEVGRKK